MKIHFIGIGGIGVSSLARYFLLKGNRVSGSDLTESELTRSLKDEGIKVAIGKHCAKNIEQGTDLVIHTPAVRFDNPEIRKAKREGIGIMSYPEALGKLTAEYYTIAVSGSHGKSTTTSMLALVMIEARMDPTVIIGTKLKEFGCSNFRMGKSKYLLIEADEYKESFLNYHPKMILLTNIDNDHLDYYGTMERIKDAFRNYLRNLRRGGLIVANGDDLNTIEVLKNKKGVRYYSLKNEAAEAIKKVLKVPGRHNISNALAAYEAGILLGLKGEKIISSLSRFEGSWRRFERFESGYKNIVLISDYAHHPTEIEKTLEAARETYPQKRIICLFQPHQQKRTEYLFDDFVRVLKAAPVDRIILSEIYGVAGRENTGSRINSKKLAFASGKNVVYGGKARNSGRYVEKIAKEGDVVIIMGAGDIYEVFLNMKARFQNKYCLKIGGVV